MIQRASWHAAALALGLAMVSCGKKGPPLPPLHIVPAAVTDVSVRRGGDQVRLRFVLPARNTNGPPPVNLRRVEIYAATVAPGAIAPTPQELISSKFLIGVVEAKPPADPEKPAADAEEDTRPAPGEAATFAETLDEAKLQPQFTAPAPAAPPAKSPERDAAAAPPPPPAVASRVYVIRGLARNGRPGQPSAAVQVPLVPLPTPPISVAADFTESAISVVWLPPVVESTAAKPPGFNVYQATSDAPLNAAPLDAPPFERAGVEFGKEECFVVSAVETFGAVSIESPATAPACVTPRDIFPPAAPIGVSAVAAAGAINLIWDANKEDDLAGYLVLRGEESSETLQAITSTPLTETTYRDTTVQPGVRYIYAVVAVDRATPPNTSPQSERVEETGR